mmetsp:Transcript_27327/g.49639  ORF Transcript_27327/g.49639 Transcript_27327/m.49639 type:complete len:893 (-) Transcript_27327:132-2810(-)
MMEEGFQSPRHRHVDTGVEFTQPTETTDEDMSGHEQSIFRTARKYIKTGRFFRPAMYLYAERKLILTFIVHFVCTMIIWCHFALVKFREQEGKVPLVANRYWLKVVVPSLEFGSMHAILFQMALIPLTMSKLSIGAGASSVINKFVPFDRMMRIHIHLGYTMISIVVLATGFFFGFFGILCADGEAAFCSKFTSEIMITGYCILGFMLIIGGTSYFRDRIPYELFYAIHHLVFLLYAITAAHTFDNVQRNNGRERSQTFKWYSATLLYYFCDRAAMYMNHRYFTSLAASSAGTSSQGTRMAILKLHRPTLFKFEPGQYAFLRVPEIDRHWHPFSIASGPESDYLEFYIEVYGEKSWTNKLWMLIDSLKDKDGFRRNNGNVKFEVKGPYGTAMGETDMFSHALVIGSGTGVVPILSMFKRHVRQLLRLDPSLFFEEKLRRNQKINQLYNNSNASSGSIYQSFTTGGGIGSENCLRKREVTTDHEGDSSSRLPTARFSLSASIRDLPTLQSKNKWAASLQEIKLRSMKAQIPIYMGVILLIPSSLGVCMIGLTLSWNTIPNLLLDGMENFLKGGTLLFQTIFTSIVLFLHNRSELLTFLDVVVILISALADWFWFAKGRWTHFQTGDMIYYLLLMGYMTLRCSHTALRTSEKSWRKEATSDGFHVMDKLHFIWITRSAHLVLQILPEIIDIWDALCSSWGPEAAAKVCKITIYVTDTENEACCALKKELRGSSLYKAGAIQFRRPDLAGIVQEHTFERMRDTSCVHSNSLLAFCGSPRLASSLHGIKIANDVSAYITGNKLHQMEFCAESYGTVRPRSKSDIYPISDEPEKDAEDDRALSSLRLNILYEDSDLRNSGTSEVGNIQGTRFSTSRRSCIVPHSDESIDASQGSYYL